MDHGWQAHVVVRPAVGATHYGGRMNAREQATEVTVVPASDVNWAVLRTVFGTRGDPSRCFCQRFMMQPGESWASVGRDELASRLRGQTDCGHPGAPTTGLVAFFDGEPVGWCAVEPRSAFPRMLRDMRVPWEGRAEDKADESVWAVTCVVARAGYRRRGISYALVRAAVDHARRSGARALEGYPMTTTSTIASELHVGTVGAFLAAGFVELGRPTIRRAVVRIDFQPPPPAAAAR